MALLATVLALAAALPAAASIPPLERTPSLNALAAQAVAEPRAPAATGERFRLYAPGEAPLASAAPTRFHLFAETKTRVRGINLDLAPRVEISPPQLPASTRLTLFPAKKSRWVDRNRHYDPELGRFLQPDPLGYVDGPNVYQYGLNNPANFSDPMGLCVGELPCPQDELESVGGYAVGLGETLWSMGVGLVTLPYKQTVGEAGRKLDELEQVRAGYVAGGLEGARLEVALIQAQRREESKEQLLGMVPFVNTYRQGSQTFETYEEQGAFEGGRQLGRTFFSAGNDATVVYGAGRAAGAARSAFLRRQLLGELAEAGVKHTPADVVRIARAGDRIIFLEKGTVRSGLRHIVKDHGAEFAAQGISEARLPDFLMKAATARFLMIVAPS